MEKLLKILHIEDNIYDAELVTNELKKGRINFIKRLATNRKQVEQALAGFQPDIVLSDHTLPSFSSKEALEMVKTYCPQIPFILVAGTVSDEYAVDIMKNGAYDYVMKDRMQRLPQSVLHAIEKSRIEIENRQYLENLIKSEALLNEAERLAHLGSWHLNLLTYESRWSDETYRIFGYEPGEADASFDTIIKHVHPDDTGYVKDKTADEQWMEHDSVKMEFRIIDRQGKLKYISTEVIVKRNENNEPVSLTGFNQDVTEARLSAASLRKSEANLKTIFDNTDTAYLLLDLNLNILSYNKIAAYIFKKAVNYTLKEGTNIINYTREERKAEVTDQYLSALNGEHLSFETSVESEDGSFSWFSYQISPVVDDEAHIYGLILAITDISEKKNAEIEKEKLNNALLESHNGLKTLLKRIQTAREEERLHIARDIHDELGQVLTALKIEISMLGKKITRNNENAFLIMDIAHIIKMVDNSILSVKRIATDLRPEMLDELGIIDAIQWQADEFTQKTGVECKISIPLENAEKLKEINISTTIYRIVQEALTNIARHAKASAVKISISMFNDNILLTVKDNGVGITPEQLNKKNSFGLTGLRERAFLLNGFLDISGEPGKGTLISVQIPLKNDQYSNHR